MKESAVAAACDRRVLFNSMVWSALIERRYNFLRSFHPSREIEKGPPWNMAAAAGCEGCFGGPCRICNVIIAFIFGSLESTLSSSIGLVEAGAP